MGANKLGEQAEIQKHTEKKIQGRLPETMEKVLDIRRKIRSCKPTSKEKEECC